MLDLRPGHPALTHHGGVFLQEGLPADLSADAFAAFDRHRYAPELVDWARQAWEMRALDEYRSQVGFTELLAELTMLGLPFDVLSSATRVVRDEARHVELCRRMVGVLGGASCIPGEPAWVLSEKRLPMRTRVLRTVVGSLCIGETMSVRMLVAVRDRARDPLSRAVLTRLAADESFHARFGWALLDLLAPCLTDEERADVLYTLSIYLYQVRQMMPPRSVARAARPTFASWRTPLAPSTPRSGPRSSRTASTGTCCARSRPSACRLGAHGPRPAVGRPGRRGSDTRPGEAAEGSSTASRPKFPI